MFPTKAAVEKHWTEGCPAFMMICPDCLQPMKRRDHSCIKKLKEELDNFVDAVGAIDETLGEDGALKLFLGESMVAVNDEAATNYVEQLQEEKQTELDDK